MLGSFILKILGLCSGFLLNIFLFRTLGIEEYGRYHYLLSIINFLSVLAIFGLDNTSLKYLSKYYAKKDYKKFFVFYKKSEGFVLKTSFLIVFLVILSTLFLFKYNTEYIFAIITCSILIPLKSLTSIYFSVLRAMEKLYLYMSLNLIIRPMFLIMLILVLKIFFPLKINSTNYFIVNILIYFSIVFFIKYFLKIYLPPKKISKNISFKPNWIFVPFYIFLIQLINLFNISINNILINFYEGASAVSLFSVALHISNVVGFALATMNIILAPKISSLYHSSKKKDLQSNLRFIAKINLIFGSIVTLFILEYGELFLKLYDNKMVASYPLILVLIIGQIFHVFCGSVTYMMIMTKLEKHAAVSAIISAILNIIMNFIFIPSYGVIGCCIATTISTIFYNFLSSIIIIKKLKLNTTILSLIRN